MTDKERIEKLLLERKQDLESRRALEEAREAKLEAKIAAMKEERAKIHGFRDYIAAFERDLAEALGLPGTASPEQPKGRRPGRWKGPDGFELVAAVLEFQATHHCKDIAPAIRDLQAKSEKWRKIKQRVLERRFQEVRKLWEPWWREMVRLGSCAEELLAKKM
jgi:hypothetical protein